MVLQLHQVSFVIIKPLITTNKILILGKDVTIFDLELGNVLRKHELSQVVSCISISSPEKRSKITPLLAVGLYSSVHIFDLMTGLEYYESIFNEYKGQTINSIKIYEGLRSILLLGIGQQLHVWDFEKSYRQTILNKFIGVVASVTISVKPKQDSEMSNVPSLIVSSDTEGYVYYHHLFTCNYLSTWKGHEGPIHSVIDCNSKEYSYVITGGMDKVARIWKTPSGGETEDDIFQFSSLSHIVDPNDIIVYELYGHEGAITSLACIVGLNMPALITASDDRSIRIWNIVSGNVIYILAGDNPLLYHTDAIKTVSITGSPRLLMVTGGCDNTTRVYDFDESSDESIKNISKIIGVKSKYFKKIKR